MAEPQNHADKVAETATDEIEIIEADEAPKDEGDKRLSAADEDDADDEGGTDDEREALREKRREERRQRRDRQNKARDRDKNLVQTLERQNQALAERLAALEGRTQQQDARDIDARLSQVQQEMAQAERALKDAVTRGDGDLLTKALRVRDDASRRAAELNGVKARISTAPSAPTIDPTIARNAQDWAADHPWYDLNGRDQDSAIVATIDAKLAEEGLDPRSEEYWDELSDRVERALPHRFKAKGKRSSPPVAGGREHAPQSTRQQVYVTKEMRQHLEEAGYWEDPVKRQKMIKRYADQQKTATR